MVYLLEVKAEKKYDLRFVVTWRKNKSYRDCGFVANPFSMYVKRERKRFFSAAKNKSSTKKTRKDMTTEEYVAYIYDQTAYSQPAIFRTLLIARIMRRRLKEMGLKQELVPFRITKGMKLPKKKDDWYYKSKKKSRRKKK